MAMASMKLIQQLRSQLPPEASESLDELESMAGDDDDPEAEDDMDEEVPASEPVQVADEDEESMEPSEDELDYVPPTATTSKKSKKKSDKLSFFA